MAVCLVGVLGITACGSGSKGSAAPISHKVRMTTDDIPDVLTPGIWPDGIKAYRDGDYVTVYTNWSDSDIILDGRTSTDVATTICNQVLNDLQEGVTVNVFAANGWEHLAHTGGFDGKCHDS
jgi:hypothetical protein